jgi:hypothetical protein
VNAGADLADGLHIVAAYFRERVHDQDMHKAIVEAIEDCFAHLPPEGES